MKIGFALLALCALAGCASSHRRPAAAEQTSSPGEEKLMFVQGPAGRLRVSDGGQGNALPVVFVHGLGSNWMVWREQLDHFRKTRRAVAYDQRAHGESDAPKDSDYKIQSMAADLHAVVASLGIDRFLLVGHSMAGTVVSAYQGRYPDSLAGVVYVDAVGDMSRLDRDAVAAVEKRAAQLAVLKAARTWSPPPRSPPGAFPTLGSNRPPSRGGGAERGRTAADWPARPRPSAMPRRGRGRVRRRRGAHLRG